MVAQYFSQKSIFVCLIILCASAFFSLYCCKYCGNIYFTTLFFKRFISLIISEHTLFHHITGFRLLLLLHLASWFNISTSEQMYKSYTNSISLSLLNFSNFSLHFSLKMSQSILLNDQKYESLFLFSFSFSQKSS